MPRAQPGTRRPPGGMRKRARASSLADRDAAFHELEIEFEAAVPRAGVSVLDERPVRSGGYMDLGSAKRSEGDGAMGERAVAEHVRLRRAGATRPQGVGGRAKVV